MPDPGPPSTAVRLPPTPAIGPAAGRRAEGRPAGTPVHSDRTRRPRGCTLSVAVPSRPQPTVSGATARASGSGVPRWIVIVAALTAQTLLALVMKGAPVFGMAQAVGVLVVGLYAVGTRNVSLVASLCGYLVGCEVLWRQNNVPLPYLSAPYLITALSVFVVIAVLGRMGRDARLAVVYFLLLVPAIVGTVRTAGGNARELIAFALSGPLALTAFVAFTSQMRADLATYRRILWVTLVSLVGPLAIALSDVGSELAASGRIEFTSASNFVTSGGFGPVQVSTVLGLGVLIGVILTIVDRDRTLQVLAGVLAAVFTVQSLLTFSRGGMFATAIALSALAVYRVRERRIRNRVIAVVAVALSLGYFVVVPWLEDFTDGAFGQRFSDVSSSRTELAANDTQLFSENIVFGVGPGMTKYQRLSYEICQLRSDRCKDEASSHTEWTRMLGEHGIPGVLSLVALIVLATRAVRNHRRERPFAIAFVTWAVAQMFYANLRVVAVPFAFGLAFLTLRQLSRAGDDDPDGDVGTDDGPGPPPPVPVVQPAVTPATWTTARATWAAAPAGVAGPRPVRINGTHPPSGNGSATPPPYHGPVP